MPTENVSEIGEGKKKAVEPPTLDVTRDLAQTAKRAASDCSSSGSPPEGPSPNFCVSDALLPKQTKQSQRSYFEHVLRHWIMVRDSQAHDTAVNQADISVFHRAPDPSQALSYLNERRAALAVVRGSSVPECLKIPLLTFPAKKPDQIERVYRNYQANNTANTNERDIWYGLYQTKDLNSPAKVKTYWTKRIVKGYPPQTEYEWVLYDATGLKRPQETSQPQAASGTQGMPLSDPTDWKTWLAHQAQYHKQQRASYLAHNPGATSTNTPEQQAFNDMWAIRLNEKITHIKQHRAHYPGSQFSETPEREAERLLTQEVDGPQYGTQAGSSQAVFPQQASYTRDLSTTTASSSAYQERTTQPTQPYYQTRQSDDASLSSGREARRHQALQTWNQQYSHTLESTDVPASYGQQETGLDRTRSHPTLVQVWDSLSCSKDYFVPLAQQATSQGRLTLVDSSNLPNQPTKYQSVTHTICIPLKDEYGYPRSIGVVSERLIYEMVNARGRQFIRTKAQHKPPSLSPTASLEEKRAYAFQMAITSLATEWYEWILALEMTLRSQAINSDPNMRNAGWHIDIVFENEFKNSDQGWFHFPNYLSTQVRTHTVLYDPAAANQDWAGWQILHNARERYANKFSITQEAVDIWRSNPSMAILPDTDNPFL